MLCVQNSDDIQTTKARPLSIVTTSESEFTEQNELEIENAQQVGN